MTIVSVVLAELARVEKGSIIIYILRFSSLPWRASPRVHSTRESAEASASIKFSCNLIEICYMKDGFNVFVIWCELKVKIVINLIRETELNAHIFFRDEALLKPLNNLEPHSIFLCFILLQWEAPAMNDTENCRLFNWLPVVDHFLLFITTYCISSVSCWNLRFFIHMWVVHTEKV